MKNIIIQEHPDLFKPQSSGGKSPLVGIVLTNRTAKQTKITPRLKHKLAIELIAEETDTPQYRYRKCWLCSCQKDQAWSQRETLYKALKRCGWYWEKAGYWSDIPF